MRRAGGLGRLLNRLRHHRYEVGAAEGATDGVAAKIGVEGAGVTWPGAGAPISSWPFTLAYFEENWSK